MRSPLSFLYGAEEPKISVQLFGTRTPIDLDETPEHFSVKWVVHRYETLPVEVERDVPQNLNKLVESCRGRTSDMRRKYPNTPPDGFLVFDSNGNEVRRWFEISST